MFLARAGQTIEAGASIVGGDAPFRGDPPGLLHPVKRRVKGSFFDAQDVVGHRRDVGRDPVSVLRTAAEGLQHEEIQRALKGVRFLRPAQHYLED